MYLREGRVSEWVRGPWAMNEDDEEDEEDERMAVPGSRRWCVHGYQEVGGWVGG